MLRLLSVYIFIGAQTVVATNSEISVFGAIGEHVKLPCNIPVANIPNVEWSDMVYSSDANPSIIFRSENNPDFEVESSHQNQRNYVIDSDFSLTIDQLNLDMDPGHYTCRSVVDGTIHEKNYYLTVGDFPRCSGNVYITKGDSIDLECETSYSGKQPLLQWFHDGASIKSFDEGEIRLARKVVSFVATHDHDQKEFVCQMSLGDQIKECNLLLNVTYLVRDVKFHPEREKFRVGDELKCSAKGNPVPRVTLLPESIQGKSGPGWHSLTVGQNWEGQRVTVQCTASNSVGSETETLSSNLTIHVSAPRKSQTTTHPTLPSETTRGVHHNRHTSMAPTPTHLTRREKEQQSRPGGHHRKHHHSTITSMPNQNEEEQAFPAAANGQEVTKNPVTNLVHYEKTYPPVIRTIEAKGRQEVKTGNTPAATGATPVKSIRNEADQMYCLGLSSMAIMLLTGLMLTVI